MSVVIYSTGPLTLSVCAPKEMASIEVIADVERQYPCCGTEHGWQLSDREWREGGNDTGRVGPIPCNKDEARTHWLLTA